jgi:hypothetical protein
VLILVCLCLCISWHFSFVVFGALFLFSSLAILIMTRHEVLFRVCLLRVQNASWSWVSTLLYRVEKFSAMISLNKFPLPLVCIQFPFPPSEFLGLIFGHVPECLHVIFIFVFVQYLLDLILHPDILSSA